MRVIAGKFRGKKLISFKGYEIRPTIDRIKESIFNIIQSEISGKIFLDLFSGTGGMGIEAISRGAKEVVFCDKEKESIEIIKKNLSSLKLDNKINECDSITFLKTTDKIFDLIFIDPPYESDLGIKSLKIIKERNLLSENGIIIFEYTGEIDLSIEKFEVKSIRKYGIVKVAFMKNI